MIRFDGVTKTYPDGTVAVDDLTLTAPTGKITALVGPSGCGKTTTLRMINRLIEPTSGSITINGQPQSATEVGRMRREMGYVIQHAGLFPHRTVVDNVATVPRLLGWSKDKARTRAAEMLELVGLDAAMGKRYPAQLSGGQQQRVGVARALAADPPIMLMDEPFSAVDPVVREQLQDEFLRLQERLGKTIVLVTHDIDEAIKLGDQVAVFGVGGRLQQVAEPGVLLRSPANDFVAGFVGRDRGYRALGFESAQLRVNQERTVRLGEPLQPETWQLVVDEAQAPLGWTRGADTPAVATAEALNRAGTLAPQQAPLRAILDACLSSPSGRGVLVDEQGALVGTVEPEAVIAAIRTQQEATFERLPDPAHTQ